MADAAHLMFFLKNDLNTFNNQIGINNSFNTSTVNTNFNGQNNNIKKEDWKSSLENCMKYFIEVEDYEKCAVCKNLIKKLDSKKDDKKRRK